MRGLALRIYKRFKRSHPVRDLHATFRFDVRSSMQYDCHNEHSNAAGVMILLGLSRVARVRWQQLETTCSRSQCGTDGFWRPQHNPTEDIPLIQDSHHLGIRQLSASSGRHSQVDNPSCSSLARSVTRTGGLSLSCSFDQWRWDDRALQF